MRVKTNILLFAVLASGLFMAFNNGNISKVVEPVSGGSSAAVSAELDLKLRFPGAIKSSQDLQKGYWSAFGQMPILDDYSLSQASVLNEGSVGSAVWSPTGVVSAVALSTTAVSITFDRKISSGSITDAASQFSFSGTMILTAVDASISERNVIVTTTDQAPGYSYSVTVADTVTDMKGIGISADSNSAGFTGFLKPGLLIVSLDGHGQSAASVPEDGIVCAYLGTDPDQPEDFIVTARSYTPLSGWSEPSYIDSQNRGVHTSDIKVSADASGNALAVWGAMDTSGSLSNIWSNRFGPGSGWAAPEIIDTDDTGSAYDVRLAMSPDGDAVAVWEQETAPDSYYYQNVWSRFYSRDIGWIGSAEMVETNTDLYQPLVNPDVAMDPEGNIFVVWRDDENDGTVYARRYDAVTGWEPQVVLGQEGFVPYNVFPVVKTDMYGNALVVWDDWDQDGSVRIMSVLYDSTDSSWGDTVQVAVTDSFSPLFPKLSMSPGGEAMVVWTQNYNYWPSGQLWAARYSPMSGWDAAVRIDESSRVATQGFNAPPYYTVAVDPDGNALAAWMQYGDGPVPLLNSLWVSRYTDGEGWGMPFEVMEGMRVAWDPEIGLVTNIIFNPEVLFDSEGNSILIWSNSHLGIMMQVLQ